MNPRINCLMGMCGHSLVASAHLWTMGDQTRTVLAPILRKVADDLETGYVSDETIQEIDAFNKTVLAVVDELEERKQEP